ncbi:hypothetical protein BD324DRAFT_599654 [Kockovaella imperatae]|uniref:Phytoene desaturase n=1 Tax=Kockovaella imperatae TaxID=4999 RepID=A0A1Y1UKX3_9TREE|nr:hypothetical protein BD324DRAFT_599654 [Kockovaella imperatae]ORX38700.1 hypothetical protein BD324DRAFT_599654 [Kockovaella imperatae]
MAPKAIIVGAGVGGIATAARLAHAGFDVEVYEKNKFSGGRCSLIHHDGHRFDQGPSLLLLPRLFRQLFNDLGTRLEDYVELVQCDPNYVLHYHDGEKVILSSDRAKLASEVEKWEGEGGAQALEGFLREAGIHGELSYSHVLAKTFPSIFSFLRPSVLFNLIALHPFATVYGRCAKYFKTERIRRAFSFGSMYLGSSPFDAPGTYTLLEWSETCEGIWYPIGGFHAVLQAVIDISTSLPHPVQYHFSAPVKSVLHSEGKATGIKLEDGSEIHADLVIVNADLVWAHNNLFERENAASAEQVKSKSGDVVRKNLLMPGFAKSLLRKPHSCSSISFYWAMNTTVPQLKAHNIFLAEDYKSSFDDIFKHHSMPKEPSFYVNVPSRVDPSAAPEGKDSIVVLVPVGHLLPSDSRKSSGKKPNNPEQNWDELVDRARKQVIEVMQARLGINGLSEMITWEGINTPLTWQSKFNLTHGSILGITHDFFNVLSFRHQARHRSIKGAYFVGASAHPGTGVPIAIAGSRLCTQEILKDHHVSLPSTYGPSKPEGVSSLDTLRRRSVIHLVEDWTSAVFPYLMGMFIASLLFLIGAASLWYTGFFEPRVVVAPAVQPSVSVNDIPRHSLPSLDMENLSQPVMWGSFAAVVLSLAYFNLSAGPAAR